MNSKDFITSTPNTIQNYDNYLKDYINLAGFNWNSDCLSTTLKNLDNNFTKYVEKIGDYNTVNRMLTEISQNKYTLTLDFAPPLAKYGYFAETGTGTHSRIGPRPFAAMAANSSELKTAIDEFMGGKVEETVQTMGNMVDVAFSKLFQKK